MHDTGLEVIEVGSHLLEGSAGVGAQERAVIPPHRDRSCAREISAG